MDISKHRSTFDLLDDLFFIFDGEGSFLEWNEAVVEVTGYSDDELAGMTPADFFEWEDAERVTTAVAEVLETGEARVEAALVTADGDRIPYEFRAARVDDATFAGIGRDVTEKRRQRAVLEERERVLREMYGIVADRERSFSEQVRALLDLGREVLGTDYGSLSWIDGDEYVFEVVSGVDDGVQEGDEVPLSATYCEVAASTERRLVVGDVDEEAPGERDRTGYTEWGITCYLGTPVFVDDEVYGTFCFYGTDSHADEFSEWDATLVELMGQWVSYELERERANDRLQRQNARLERFTHVVAHDLRNPLESATGYLELAREEHDSEHLAEVERAHDRMAELIDDLLELARAGEAIDDPRPVDLGALAERCRGVVAAGGATLSVETDRTILADESRLRQLLANLFRNSVEHGSTGSRPEAGDSVEHGSTGSRSGGLTVTVGDLDDGFFVADDGSGFSGTDPERAFEDGYSTRAGGTGLGLTVVEEIAGAHGWSVRATHAADGGARFEVTGVEDA